jgi:hypothetical protein
MTHMGYGGTILIPRSPHREDNIKMDFEETRVWMGFIWLRIESSGGLSITQ